MALFKVLRRSKDTIARTSPTKPPFNDGYAYFTPDDSRFYIDVQLDTAPVKYFDSGVVNGKTIYRIEVESYPLNALYDVLNDKADLHHVHTIDEITTLSTILTTGTGSFTDANVTINVDLQADWTQTDSTKANFIKNKPTIINTAITVDEAAKTLFITSPVTNGDGVSY